MTSVRIAALFFLIIYISSCTSLAKDSSVDWARDSENKRKADLGNGMYLNPIMAGDHPDPSILKDGNDYYMTFSSFDAYPGLMIWHSKDLVNWEPVGPALFKNVGSIWAPDLTKHDGKYYIYFPGRKIGYSPGFEAGTSSTYRSNYVVWAEDIKGPWSDPIDLNIPHIDPGHAVGEDGKRYLFLSAGHRVVLSDDGLSVAGEIEKVYDGWQYPDEWVVESFSQEGPKMVKKGDYYYMVLAEGGTAGPPTGHMVIAARSKSIHGPWENSPYNAIVRTRSREEKWWSKGHATLFEGPDKKWYLVYHAYENGFYNLGRQTILEPVVWTDDGWFKSAGYDVSKPIPIPTGGEAVEHGFAFSDDFSTNKMGIQWSFYEGKEADAKRYRYENNSLILKASGTAPNNSAPLWFVTGDHAYQVEVEIEITEGTRAGLILFYNKKLYAGLGFEKDHWIMHRYGTERILSLPDYINNKLHIRLINDQHILSMYYSIDGQNWERYPTRIEVSGYHHNVMYDFLSLRPAIYVAGKGEAIFRNFKYQAL